VLAALEHRGDDLPHSLNRHRGRPGDSIIRASLPRHGRGQHHASGRARVRQLVEVGMGRQQPAQEPGGFIVGHQISLQ
jgi:hypothetical protein